MKNKASSRLLDADEAHSEYFVRIQPNINISKKGVSEERGYKYETYSLACFV